MYPVNIKSQRMIKSMTGFGKAIGELHERKVTVEIKSLNSKQMDLSVRMPNIYKEYEMPLRNYLSNTLERGKVDFLLYTESINGETSNSINQSVVEAYHKQITESAAKLGVSVPNDWFTTLLRMPDVMKYEVQEIDSEEWSEVLKIVEEAVAKLNDFRQQEGQMLEDLFKTKIANIKELLISVDQFDADRIEKVRTRITESIENLNVDYDKNRLEQELIYYIEKLDVNEEKNRLNNHLKYFIVTLRNGSGQGKKLGFITQEIGREINTLGSKANNAEMQQIVVQMKDELEQIKEQVLNVL